MFTRVEEWVEEQQGRLEERLEEASQEEEQEKVKERMGEIKGAAGFVDCHDFLFTSMDIPQELLLHCEVRLRSCERLKPKWSNCARDEMRER